MALSYNEVVAGTGQTLVTVTFPFLDRTHVKVSVNRVDLPGSAWTWVSDASIQLSEPLVGGETVRSYRETPAAGVQADFQPGAFDYEELNTSLSHLLYIVQEAYDNAVAAVEAGHSAFAYLVQVEELADEIALIFADVQAIQTALTGHSDATVATINSYLATATALRNETITLRDTALAYRNQAQTEATKSQDQAAISTAKAAEASTSASQAALRKGEVESLKAAVEGLESTAATSAMTATSAMAAVQTLYDNFMSAYENFNDRYLGSKASPPTTDNDGQALIGGALYFDTTAESMKVWDGSAWRAAYVSYEGDPLLKANNLGDLSNVPQARINLGLGSVDNTPDAAKPISAATQAALDALGGEVNTLEGDLTGKVSKALNLSDVPDKATARVNLGLGRALPTTGATAPAGTDLNTIVTPGFDQSLHIGTQPNGWGVADYAYILVLEYAGAQITQFAFPYQGGAPRFRDRYSGTWSAWKTLAHVVVSSAAPSGPSLAGEIWVQI